MFHTDEPCSLTVYSHVIYILNQHDPASAVVQNSSALAVC